MGGWMNDVGIAARALRHAYLAHAPGARQKRWFSQ